MKYQQLKRFSLEKIKIFILCHKQRIFEWHIFGTSVPGFLAGALRGLGDFLDRFSPLWSSIKTNGSFPDIFNKLIFNKMNLFYPAKQSNARRQN